MKQTRKTPEGQGIDFQLIIGSEIQLVDGLKLVLLATDRASYGRLTALITHARRRAEKGSYALDRDGLSDHVPDGCLALWLPALNPDPEQVQWLHEHFPGCTWIATELLLNGSDRVRLDRLRRLDGGCICRYAPVVTCTCIVAIGAPYKIPSRQFACGVDCMNWATPCIRTENGICGPVSGWHGCAPPIC